jgi:hypothetical protein
MDGSTIKRGMVPWTVGCFIGVNPGWNSERGITESRSPSLLTCLHQFVQVRRQDESRKCCHTSGPDATLRTVQIHVPRLKDENTTELFLGFRIGTVGRFGLAVLPIRSKQFPQAEALLRLPNAVGAKMVVIFKAGVEHGVLLALGHGFEFVFVKVRKTDVFHCSSAVGLCLGVGASSTSVADSSVTVSSNEAQQILI